MVFLSRSSMNCFWSSLSSCSRSAVISASSRRFSSRIEAMISVESFLARLSSNLCLTFGIFTFGAFTSVTLPFLTAGTTLPPIWM